MRCLSWVAVSSKPQTEKESPTEQREENQKIIDALGGQTVAVLEVPGESREIIGFEDACQRIDAYAQLRAHIDAKDADLIVCRDLSRLGRTTALITQVVSYCHRAGIAIYSRAAPPSSLDAAEQAASEGATLMLALEGALSQTEMIKLRRRHEYGMTGRVKKGRFYARIPYGYVKIFDNQGNDTYAIDEAQAAVVRLIFSLYLERGMGTLRIASELNRQGHASPSGGEWHYSGIQGIIGRVQRYAGWAEGNVRGARQYIKAPGAWEPIITQEIADAVQRERKHRETARRNSTTFQYRFAKALYCSECGKRMWAGGETRPDGSEYLNYYCGNRRCHKRNGIDERRVLEIVESDIASIDIDEMALPPPPTDDSDKLIALAEAELASLDTERARLLSAYTRLAAITEDDLTRGMDEIAQRQQAIERRIDELHERKRHNADQVGRMARLQTVVNIGLSILHSDDIPLVNAWIRRHLRIYIQDNEVERIDYL